MGPDLSRAGYILLIAVVLFLRLITRIKQQTKKSNAAPPPTGAQTRRAEPPVSGPEAQPRRQTPIREVGEKKREQMARAEQWRYAKAQQDDAAQVHSIRMDSCEQRLESLRVLYDAGILDREEFEQRVARVKSAHRDA